MTFDRGRVIRTPKACHAVAVASTAARPEPIGSTARAGDRRVLPAGTVMHRQRREAVEQAQAIVQQAQDLAHRIEQEAREQAKQALAHAHREGVDRAHAQVASAWIELQRQRVKQQDDLVDQCAVIIKAMTERLVGEVLELHPERIAVMVRDAIRPLRRARRITIHAHPNDAQVLTDQLDKLGVDSDIVQVASDTQRCRGSLHFYSDCGEINADLQLQLDKFVYAIREHILSPGSDTAKTAR